MAWAGTALGVDQALTGDEPRGEVSIAGSNITVSSSGENVTIAENLSVETAVTVAKANGRITVQTSNGGPLTDQQRADAVGIVRDNETIQRLLDQLTDPTLSIDPVKRLDADSARRTSGELTPTNVTQTANDTQVFTIESADDVHIDRTENSVTVETKQSSGSYVENRAIVRIRDDNRELVYSAKVDLQKHRVVDVTDWRDA